METIFSYIWCTGMIHVTLSDNINTGKLEVALPESMIGTIDRQHQDVSQSRFIKKIETYLKRR
jgi:hypothetical protein